MARRRIARLASPLRHATVHGAAQTASQVVAFVTGILVVRALEKTEYAQYSVAVAAIAAAALVAESGVGATLMSIGGRTHEDGAATARLFASAVRVRYLLGIPIVLVACGWMVVLLLQNGMNADGALLLAAIAVFTFAPTFSASILRIYYRLSLRTTFMQVVDVSSALVRLVLVLTGMALSIISPAYMLLGGLLVAVGTLIAYMLGARSLRLFGSPQSDYYPQFWLSVRQVLPMTLFMVAAEQALLAIASFRGDAEIVAEMAALSRFAIAFTVLNAVVVDIIAPRFARAPNDRDYLAKLVVGSFTGYFALVGIFVLAVWLTSPILLALLGPEYAGLVLPLVLFAAGYGVANLAQSLNVIGQARGWTRMSWVYIPLSVVWFLVSVFLLPLNTVTDVAVMFILQTVPALVTQFVRVGVGLNGVPAHIAPPAQKAGVSDGE